MAQSGIHAFSGIILSKLFKQKKWFAPSLILGSILPDVDILFSAIAFLFGASIVEAEEIHRTFTHSIFTVLIIYLVFLSIKEIKSDKKFKIIGKGICIGMTAHIILDVCLWFHDISLLWPLQPYLIDPINIWGNISLSHSPVFKKILLAFEFIMFRLYGWFLINQFINIKNIGNTPIWFIKYMTKWIKIEFILFITFLLLIYINININIYMILFTLMYIPSLMMALISTYVLRNVFNNNDNFESK